MNQKLAKGAAAVGAVGVLVFGAAAIGGANSNSSSGATQRTGFGPGGGAPPGGARPGLGTPVADDVAKKVAKAATAKYPGQVERVDQTPDGSYVAHVITSSGEVHVLVSKDFEVTGKADFGDRGRIGAQRPTR